MIWQILFVWENVFEWFTCDPYLHLEHLAVTFLNLSSGHVHSALGEEKSK